MEHKINQEMSDEVALKLLNFYKELTDTMSDLDRQENIMLNIDIDSFFEIIINSYHISSSDENYEHLMGTFFDFIHKYGEEFSIEFIKYLKNFDGLQD